MPLTAVEPHSCPGVNVDVRLGGVSDLGRGHSLMIRITITTMMTITMNVMMMPTIGATIPSFYFVIFYLGVKECL
jgi:hypothetical protein